MSFWEWLGLVPSATLKQCYLDRDRAVNTLMGVHLQLANTQADNNRLVAAVNKLNVALHESDDYCLALKGVLNAQGIKPPGFREHFWNSKYPKLENPVHIARPLPKTGAGMMRVDVRDFCQFSRNPFIVQVATGGYGLNIGDDDARALKCCAWVQDHIEYLSDKTQTGYSEYWFYPTETLELKHCDCEDGAILLYNLMRAAGIPAWKLRLVFGNVNYQGSTAGHVYLTYLYEGGTPPNGHWVILDWCWYPNKKPIAQRPDYKKEATYIDVKLSWNEDFAFSKNPISKMA